ncbi:MAG TPA: dephospho-CoA kinase [Rhodospirillales bacterium]|jgi:dephospho-CoA kinase|nr:dephospho-CoA kinase [Rhodospirillales bacterium]
MVILGLTGSIGMGKSTAAAAFRYLGVAVHDADAAVDGLMGKGGGAVKAVAAAFCGVARKGEVIHEKLALRVFGDPQALLELESILHPMVRLRQRQFLSVAARQGRPLVVLEVPLLFETKGEEHCDGVVVVSAPRFVQKQRVLARSGMTEKRLNAILSRQMTDAEKQQRADFIVNTGLGRNYSLRAIENVVNVTARWQGAKWPNPGLPERMA